MKLPVQVTFRNVPSSEEIEAEIRERAENLNTYYDPITACRVLVEIPHQHHKRGNRYHVRISLTIPGDEIVVSHQPSFHSGLQHEGQDRSRKEFEPESADRCLKVAIHEVFHIARRGLQDHARRRRGDVKTHESASHARVIWIAPGSNFGHIQTLDGRTIYFHRNSVLGGRFEDLTLGANVTFAEERDEKGPQASTVKIVRSPSRPHR